MALRDLLILSADPLTINYGDNTGKANITDQAQSIIFVDYTHGTEKSVQILFEFSHREAPDDYFIYSALDSSFKLLDKVIFAEVTGKYRIPVPSSLFEDSLRISVRAETPLGGAPGKVSVYHHNSRYRRPPF